MNRSYYVSIKADSDIGATVWLGIASHQYRAISYQQGAALIVALILLLIMSILGLSSIRSTVMEEKMTTASYDRSLAFQAAEAALRAGEAIAVVQSRTGNAGFSSSSSGCSGGCTAQGLCQPLPSNCTPRWHDPNNTLWAEVDDDWTNSDEIKKLVGTPGYFVEFLGPGPCDPNIPETAGQFTCSHYRITARSQPGAGRAEVILQSIYVQ